MKKLFNKAFLSLGTNLGNKTENINNAIKELGSFLTIKKISKTYETPPWGFEDQDSFYNICLEVETGFSASDLLHKVKQAEVTLGRIPTFNWGPRLIDIDIIFFNSDIINNDNLKIPHPFMHERAFVLVPLCDLIPDFIHPVLNKKIIDLKDKTKTDNIIIITNEI